ncbi:hypothetical protein T4D_11875 [Trichinella pseudospiralis]|uniref:Uncharacterized protein n=1 Tax=Trichinella pseudospiralis TaxID=6337 RepID=A0A0V1FLJ3_TRIPS|nr:hypothetical protein T4D_11875 [Trichinella pseudospiralis]
MCRKCVKPMISGKFYCDTSLSYLIICYQFYFLSLTLCETLRFLTPHVFSTVMTFNNRLLLVLFSHSYNWKIRN